MSKSKSKSAPKANKSDVLTKVKGAAVTKPAQNIKVKSKETAKKVAAKEEKKNKKDKKTPVKEPTPEPSSAEDDSDASSDEDSDGKDKVQTKKTNGAKAIDKEESSDESDSDDSASEDEAPKQNGSALKAGAPAKTTAKASDSEDGASSSEESDSDDGKDSANKTKGVKAVSADEDDDSSDESESDGEEKVVPKTNGAKLAAGDDDSSDGDDSEDSNDSESEAKVETKPAKRKAEEDAAPASKKSKVEDIDTSRGPNLFVGNLSWNVDEDWMRQEFEEFGELSGVRLMTDRETGRSKGFGYVEFVNAVDAAKAHRAKQGAELDGRVMNVDFANARQSTGDRQDNRRKSYGDQTGEPTETLFLGNLSFDVTQDDVSEAFAPHGTVLGVRLPTDRETGAPKGFGYVTFASVEEATTALEAVQGGYIKSRAVRLDYSQPRPQNGDSPGRGGFGGRGGRGGFGGRGRGGRGDFGGRGGGRGGRGGRGGSTNRGGFGDFSGRKTTF